MHFHAAGLASQSETQGKQTQDEGEEETHAIGTLLGDVHEMSVSVPEPLRASCKDAEAATIGTHGFRMLMERVNLHLNLNAASLENNEGIGFESAHVNAKGKLSLGPLMAAELRPSMRLCFGGAIVLEPIGPAGGFTSSLPALSFGEHRFFIDGANERTKMGSPARPVAFPAWSVPFAVEGERRP